MPRRRRPPPRSPARGSSTRARLPALRLPRLSWRPSNPSDSSCSTCRTCVATRRRRQRVRLATRPTRRRRLARPGRTAVTRSVRVSPDSACRRRARRSSRRVSAPSGRSTDFESPPPTSPPPRPSTVHALRAPPRLSIALPSLPCRGWSPPASFLPCSSYLARPLPQSPSLGCFVVSSPLHGLLLYAYDESLHASLRNCTYLSAHFEQVFLRAREESTLGHRRIRVCALCSRSQPLATFCKSACVNFGSCRSCLRACRGEPRAPTGSTSRRHEARPRRHGLQNDFARLCPGGSMEDKGLTPDLGG